MGRGIGRGVVLGAVVTVLAVAPLWPARAQVVPCPPGRMPYAGLAGASLAPEVHVSRDAVPVRYVRWRGTVPSFDGLPLSVDVTLPCGAAGPEPTVVMTHGFTDDKTVWEETGKSDTVESPGRPGSNSRWNNVWFASRGYAVLNYTARGWHDSCGPNAPGATALTPAPQCAGHQYWIHLDDKRWEVRDAQWLAGGLVQSGHADPARLAITGGSYGGAPAAMAAMLADRVMCGGSPVPAALGPDPCAGRGDGQLAPWTTPDGTTPLTWVAALPLYTFGDLLNVLAPNGRASDGWALAPPPGDTTNPVGVPIETTIVGLLAAGATTGFFAPPLVDPGSDIIVDAARLLAGNPFLQQDPLVARGVDVYRRFKSPATTAPQGRVPIFWVQGSTDALFTAMEPFAVAQQLRAADPRYPFKLFLGDIGHDYAAERKDEWDLVKAQMNAFLDHYLRPDRTPEAPRFDVGATVTRCLDHDAPMRFVSAPTWDELHPDHVTFTSTAPGVTSTLLPGPGGLATDPVSTATLPLPGSYKGCRIMRPSSPDPTVVTATFPVDHDMVLMGGPVMEVAFTTTGPDVPLSVRLWDVAPDGSAQGLVTRGTYRVAGGAGAQVVRFQLAPQGYRFPAGHSIKVEVTANDAPYRQPSNLPAVVVVDRVQLTLPLLGQMTSVAAARPGPVVTTAPARPPVRQSLPATGGRPFVWWAGALAASALALRGLQRRAMAAGTRG